MKAMEAMDYEYLIRAVFKCGRTRRFEYCSNQIGRAHV